MSVYKQSYSSYIIVDINQFLENWQDAIDEKGLTFWFGFRTGNYLHQLGNLDWVVQTWSNHVGAAVYVHYFKNIDAYRIGQIYNDEIALQVRQAVFILKHDPTMSSLIQDIPRNITNTPQVKKISSSKLNISRSSAEKLANNSHSYCNQHIRKPRNAWIIFRQETMVKFRDQIGHLHTSEQSKVISKIWKGTPKHIKDLYTSRAHKEKADLLAQYPNYRVQPRKSFEIRKRIKNKYPHNLTFENLNKWILDNGVQMKSVFSHESGSTKCSPTSSRSFCLDAKKRNTDEIRSDFDPPILSDGILMNNIVVNGKAIT